MMLGVLVEMVVAIWLLFGSSGSIDFISDSGGSDDTNDVSAGGSGSDGGGRDSRVSRGVSLTGCTGGVTSG